MDHSSSRISTLERRLEFLTLRIAAAHHALDATSPGLHRQRLREKLSSLQDEAIIVRRCIRDKERQLERIKERLGAKNHV